MHTIWALALCLHRVESIQIRVVSSLPSCSPLSKGKSPCVSMARIKKQLSRGRGNVTQQSPFSSASEVPSEGMPILS